MINILHLYPRLNITCGITRTIYLVCKNLNDNCKQSVFTLAGDAIDKFNCSGISTIVSSNKTQGILETIKIFIEIINIVKNQKINIIHSHHRYFDFIAFIISKFIPVKTVTSIQSKTYGKILFSYKSDCLIACSDSIKKHLIKYFNIDQKRIRVIYNFVDPKEVVITIQRPDLRSTLGIDDQSMLIGFIGRFSVREKGIDILLESFKKIYFENNNIYLILIGDGEDKDYVKKFVASNNFNAFILTPKENIYDYFNLIDVVVLPSKVDPFPLVMIETGLMKKAFIGSDVDGIKEFIENGKNGFLLPTENVDLLTEKLNDLINNPELRKKFGNELYRKVINNFTCDKIIPLYTQTYQQLIEDDR